MLRLKLPRADLVPSISDGSFVRIADLRHWHRQCSVLGASHKVTL